MLGKAGLSRSGQEVFGTEAFDAVIDGMTADLTPGVQPERQHHGAALHSPKPCSPCVAQLSDLQADAAASIP